MNIKEKVKSTVTNVIEGWIDTELVEWPPDCVAFLYQPERPLYALNSNKKSELLNQD